MEGRPSAGVEDLVIVPLVVIALAVSKLLKAVFSILIYVLDYAFPILLQLMRIPLLTAQLIGDGMELLLEGVLRCLPVSRAKRDAWRARVRQQWIWFRRNISYRAFEDALHHTFEAGMAGVQKMPKAAAQWRAAGPRHRVALVACIFWHRDGIARHPHCTGEVITGMDATAAPLRNFHR
jgi:hypothetical protein